ncbi:hypothetical protein NECAME_10551 [Necator americanus]|uniref:Uncharacterized protein n=1 Tax=Necator americanus TaxID=51031 RepID=W2TAV9_NECAM|nr:hypothetical protein NECAME_10551 [Necator americanus]ETN78152.1 hypothetical protein NECAME_10551 [Necator americanus]
MADKEETSGGEQDDVSFLRTKCNIKRYDEMVTVHQYVTVVCD